VPYPGSPQAVTDLLAGRVSMMLGVASTMLPQVAAGKLTALATSSATRARVAPDVPTIAEAGVLGFEATVWFGLMARSGTPPVIIDKLAAAANDALNQEAVATKLRTSGFEPLGGEPAQFKDFIANETTRWRAAAVAAGLAK
jgi:tripartite-type tricarboxylate transporter receptor subunit TctC